MIDSRLLSRVLGPSVIGAIGIFLFCTGVEAASLADRIPTVTHRQMSKADRVEAELSLGWVLNDPLYYEATGAFGIGYHFGESLGLRLRGTYFGAIERYPTVLVGKVAALPIYNRPLYDGTLELEWAPLYGKWSFLGNAFQSFDAYLLLGGGVVGTVEEEPTWQVTAGFGQRLFWNQALVWFWEIRGRGFEMERLAGATNVELFQITATFTLGFMLYLPFEPDYGN